MNTQMRGSVPEASGSQGKHTPGPWHVETVYDEGTSIAVRDSVYGLFIAMVEPHDMEHADAHANARLIAAAPELLAALQELVAYGAGDLTHARAAIAKAMQP